MFVLSLLSRIKMYSKKEKWERLERSGAKRGKSETDESVWACCQNSASKCSGRPGSATAGPDSARQDIGRSDPQEQTHTSPDRTADSIYSSTGRQTVYIAPQQINIAPEWTATDQTAP